MACLIPALGLTRWLATKGRDRLLFPLVAAIVLGLNTLCPGLNHRSPRCINVRN
ncbi:hypothetical protein [Spirulina major]|uniref:hypothetical protein n=1 Tax=Spirulina major TaxID=270636 RepID=UPI001587334D|nr:hypothetical protein [Spirulina major]